MTDIFSCLVSALKRLILQFFFVFRTYNDKKTTSTVLQTMLIIWSE